MLVLCCGHDLSGGRGNGKCTHKTGRIGGRSWRAVCLHVSCEMGGGLVRRAEKGLSLKRMVLAYKASGEEGRGATNV